MDGIEGATPTTTKRRRNTSGTRGKSAKTGTARGRATGARGRNANLASLQQSGSVPTASAGGGLSSPPTFRNHLESAVGAYMQGLVPSAQAVGLTRQQVISLIPNW